MLHRNHFRSRGSNCTSTSRSSLEVFFAHFVLRQIRVRDDWIAVLTYNCDKMDFRGLLWRGRCSFPCVRIRKYSPPLSKETPTTWPWSKPALSTLVESSKGIHFSFPWSSSLCLNNFIVFTVGLELNPSDSWSDSRDDDIASIKVVLISETVVCFVTGMATETREDKGCSKAVSVSQCYLLRR